MEELNCLYLTSLGFAANFTLLKPVYFIYYKLFASRPLIISKKNTLHTLLIMASAGLHHMKSCAGHTQELEYVDFGSCALDILEYRWQLQCTDMVLISTTISISGNIKGTTL